VVVRRTVPQDANADNFTWIVLNCVFATDSVIDIYIYIYIVNSKKVGIHKIINLKH
jgi:hypothetical protein